MTRTYGRRRPKRKRRRPFARVLLLALLIGFVVVTIRVAADPGALPGFCSLFRQRSRQLEFDGKHASQAKSILVVDRARGDILLAKDDDVRRLPASLAKLFVVDFASTVAGLEETVWASQEAIALTKEGSSQAWIVEQSYSLHNLFAAMLVPSGNDAAYVVADYCGGRIDSTAATTAERIDVFMKALRRYLDEQGFRDTMFGDPSGFDEEATTTARDLRGVADRLLEHAWFREIVASASHVAELPDGGTVTWENTNAFLDETSDHYRPGVGGIKTGSLGDDYNLLVLYAAEDREFLVVSLGSSSHAGRYDDVRNILDLIDSFVEPKTAP